MRRWFQREGAPMPRPTMTDRMARAYHAFKRGGAEASRPWLSACTEEDLQTAPPLLRPGFMAIAGQERARAAERQRFTKLSMKPEGADA